MQDTTSSSATATNTHHRLKKPKKPIAFLFATLCPGLGHIYCGHYGAGFAVFILCHILWAALVAFLAWMDTSLTTSLYVLLIWLVLMHGAQIIWAVVVCGNKLEGFTPKAINHPLFYIMMIGIGFFAPERLLLREFCIESYTIPSESMIPSVLIGDVVLVNKLKQARPGDIIVYQRTNLLDDSPLLPNREEQYMDYMARLVALEGQTVEFIDGHLHLDGKRVAGEQAGEYSYLSRDPLEGEVSTTVPLYVERIGSKKFEIVMEYDSQEFGPFTVPAGEFFVAGDNRDNSLDSRYFSTLPVSRISGVATEILFSEGERIRWDRIGKSL